MRKPPFTFLACIMLGICFLSCSSEKKTEQGNTFAIDYEKFTLDNGLEVVLHKDSSDPIVAVATVIHVGSNREKPGRTGFAHFFEHMSFNDSENVPRGANRKVIPEWGGSRNGGTWSDGTIYYEVVPKDAFEKIMWIDSDRLGYMINTVTEEALEREKQVVKNEKRQRVDNAPYGYTNEIIRKHLYPEGHPYNWTVIGSLPDLQAATLEDVKEFYEQFYGAGNATLVIAGDIDIAETKESVKKWFGEIRKGPEVSRLSPQPVALTETKSLYFEDNFAKLPELRLVFPTVESYHKDEYALNILGELLSGSKRSPIYKTIVEEKKLAPNASSYNRSSELAGEFVIRVRANASSDLDSVKVALDEALKQFETNRFSDNELKRIKAELETDLYNGVSTILNKAFQLAQDNEYAGDPSYITKAAQLTNAVTKEDVMRVFDQYIKGKHFVMTSVVPKGQVGLAVTDASEAAVWQEKIVADVASEEVSQGEEAVYEKTKTKIDRSEPDFGDLPLFKAPEIWTSSLPNGMELYGIFSDEVPLVNFNITIQGGHQLDTMEKSGVANLMTDLMMEGTANRTPAELEEAIGLLGANINMFSGRENIVIAGNCLAKNFEATLALVEEILLQPRWDKQEFERLKKALQTRLKGREANPSAIASLAFDKLIYGDDHIFSLPTSGTLETVSSISLEDLKNYYSGYISPSLASFHVAGFVKKDRVEKALSGLSEKWKPKAVELPSFQLPRESHAGKIFFIDVPGAKQSVIYAGKLALSATDANANNLRFANEILGGGSSGRLFQTLRIEKGYTYGAGSRIRTSKEIAPFLVRTSVRANATLPSLQIIEDLVGNYGKTFSEADVETTKEKILKASTRAYESLGQKLDILNQISSYSKPLNYLEVDQKELVEMSLEDFKKVIARYLNEDEMFYLVVGDKATQLDMVNKFGKGEAIELDIYGNSLGAVQL
ncbi:M16 family metallopeptidase [Sungkyunkwania multivorans]|uniref:M16 family metallopeptidase n=1 Tax=Sungkyunkwania multivorans TaxID=1173618 RepID=A0ABW3CZ68_9FLAO